jgi:hypothetical protein
MCFYIFSPGNYINIAYLSESVSLGSWGGSSVISDLIIENSQDTGEIAELVMLFPKALYDVEQRRKNRVPEYLRVLQYKNRTHEILQEDSLTNKTYQLSGIEVERDPGSTTLPESGAVFCGCWTR